MFAPNRIHALFLLVAIAVLLFALPWHPVSFHGGNLTCAFAIIQIKNGTCQPADVFIYKNATVVWMNPGPEEHAISVGDDMSPPIMAGESFTKNFHEFGEYEYYCRYHPSERGRVIVR
jgi:plastocyanin